MAYSKTQIGGFLAGAAVIAVVAVVGFGVPLGTLLIGVPGVTAPKWRRMHPLTAVRGRRGRGATRGSIGVLAL